MKSVALLDCPSILKGGVLGGCISILWASAPGANVTCKMYEAETITFSQLKRSLCQKTELQSSRLQKVRVSREHSVTYSEMP